MLEAQNLLAKLEELNQDRFRAWLDVRHSDEQMFEAAYSLEIPDDCLMAADPKLKEEFERQWRSFCDDAEYRYVCGGRGVVQSALALLKSVKP